MQELLKKYIVDDFGVIKLPKDNSEQKALAKILFGQSIVNNIDYWIKYTFDFIENAEPNTPFPRENALSKKDKLYRQAFSKLTTEAKDKIKQLMGEALTGVIFSLLTNIDQFDFGELEITLKPKTKESEEVEIELAKSNEIDNLHNDLFEWIYHFSKYKNSLVERLEGKYGVSYSLKQ